MVTHWQRIIGVWSMIRSRHCQLLAMTYPTSAIQSGTCRLERNVYLLWTTTLLQSFLPIRPVESTSGQSRQMADFSQYNIPYRGKLATAASPPAAASTHVHCIWTLNFRLNEADSLPCHSTISERWQSQTMTWCAIHWIICCAEIGVGCL